MAHDLSGESPVTTRQEEGLAESNGVVARRGREEAGSKALARRTGSASEAIRLDEVARHTKVQSLYGIAGL